MQVNNVIKLCDFLSKIRIVIIYMSIQILGVNNCAKMSE